MKTQYKLASGIATFLFLASVGPAAASSHASGTDFDRGVDMPASDLGDQKTAQILLERNLC